ncbi:hypothetical protein ART_1776 [Arthrobacter sp. PAMC 25486]|nr:hypothetical protein ART_1776 [Arthrobacter sp. PAMC 25486]
MGHFRATLAHLVMSVAPLAGQSVTTVRGGRPVKGDFPPSCLEFLRGS